MQKLHSLMFKGKSNEMQTLHTNHVIFRWLQLIWWKIQSVISIMYHFRNDDTTDVLGFCLRKITIRLARKHEVNRAKNSSKSFQSKSIHICVAAFAFMSVTNRSLFNRLNTIIENKWIRFVSVKTNLFGFLECKKCKG